MTSVMMKKMNCQVKIPNVPDWIPTVKVTPSCQTCWLESRFLTVLVVAETSAAFVWILHCILSLYLVDMFSASFVPRGLRDKE